MGRLSLTVLVSVLAMALSSPATGMGFTVSLQPLAWSKDGRSVLLAIHGHGPEGGGYLEYRLISVEWDSAMTIQPSNDASPGDGSTPQWVSKDGCKEQLGRLGKRLAKLGFDNVKVDKSKCDKDSRYELIAVEGEGPKSAPISGKAPGSPVEVAGVKIANAGESVTVHAGKKLLLKKAIGSTGETLNVYVSPTSELLLVLNTADRRTERVLLAMKRDPKAKEPTWKELELTPSHKR